MAYNDSIRGGIAGGASCLLFDTKQKRVSTQALTESLGTVAKVILEGGEGFCQLVQANTTVAKNSVTGSVCFKWNDMDAYEVVVTSGAGDEICGFGAPGLEALVANDFFWMILPGGGSPRAEFVTTAAVITAGDFVQATTAGAIVTDATFDHANPGTSFGEAMETTDGTATTCKVNINKGQFFGRNA